MDNEILLRIKAFFEVYEIERESKKYAQQKLVEHLEEEILLIAKVNEGHEPKIPSVIGFRKTCG